tara:strand:- start:961 stop:1602 length:642 start_codon:yes stop_codon:yes gene_type:complete
MHHKIKHVIWDWNGTLVNDAWLFVELMNEELVQRNLPMIDIENYREHFTFPVKQYYKNLGFDFTKENFKEVGYNFIQKYKSRKHEPLLFDETKKILNQISELGISQSIVSAQEHKLLQESVAHYKIADFFESINGIDHYYADSKIKIAEKNVCELEYINQEVMIVGDTAHDLEVANTLNIKCVLFSGGHYSNRRLKLTGSTIINNLVDVINFI